MASLFSIYTCFSVQMCHLLVSNENKRCCFFLQLMEETTVMKAVLDRNMAENILRVLYPNDNVRF